MNNLNYVLCWLASSDSNGQPNVSPKELFFFLNPKQLIIANINSPKSLENIKVNPKVCISLIDIFIQKGQKINGVCKIIYPNQRMFNSYQRILHENKKHHFSIKNFFEIKIVSTKKIWAPSYHLNELITEEKMIEEAFITYKIDDLKINNL